MKIFQAELENIMEDKEFDMNQKDQKIKKLQQKIEYLNENLKEES